MAAPAGMCRCTMGVPVGGHRLVQPEERPALRGHLKPVSTATPRVLRSSTGSSWVLSLTIAPTGCTRSIDASGQRGHQTHLPHRCSRLCHGADRSFYRGLGVVAEETGFTDSSGGMMRCTQRDAQGTYWTATIHGVVHWSMNPSCTQGPGNAMPWGLRYPGDRRQPCFFDHHPQRYGLGGPARRWSREHRPGKRAFPYSSIPHAT